MLQRLDSLDFTRESEESDYEDAEKEAALEGFQLQEFSGDAVSIFPRVLLTDDMVFNSDALNFILRALKLNPGDAVHTALNGYQALAQVEGQSEDNFYHIVFMDCNMPYMDGY